MKKRMALLLAVLLLAALTACAAPRQAADTGASRKPVETVALTEKTVGICLPDQSSQRWQEEAQALTALLEKRDCQVRIEDACQDAALQADQVAQLIALPVDCLIVAAVDSIALLQVLEQAKSAGIPVIAYDRLLMGTDAVSCYVGFDNQAAGRQIGQYIADAKQLQTAQQEARSYTVEFFMGSPEDSSAVLQHMGVMEVLQPYLDGGVLVCRSGRVAFEDTCVQNWSEDTAKNDCMEHLTEFYTDAPPDILCAASDALAQGCRAALEQSGHTAGEGWPLITGQDASLEAAQRILSGHQSMTVLKESHLLTQLCIDAVDAVLSGVADSWADGVCNNGVMDVPACLCTPVAVDAANIQEILVDGGIFSQAQLSGESE